LTSNDSKPSSDCPFCEPSADRILIERKHFRILRDGYPISPGHILIVPMRHVARWEETSQSEQRALIEAIELAQAEIREQRRPDGFNIGINDGVAAGQTIPHLHIHVIPRYAGDLADPRGGVRWVIPDRADYWSDRER
jgi:diadenosine tetraphosphate (Ap4A) HIT family hydrolase